MIGSKRDSAHCQSVVNEDSLVVKEQVALVYSHKMPFYQSVEKSMRNILELLDLFSNKGE